MTGELDSATADQVMEMIFEAWRQRGLTVLYVTHSAELAARAQRRLGLSDGAVGGCDERAPASGSTRSRSTTRPAPGSCEQSTG